jgi:hypothetical protein
MKLVTLVCLVGVLLASGAQASNSTGLYPSSNLDSFPKLIVLSSVLQACR